MGIFDFLKRKKKPEAKNYGYQRVVDDTKRPQTAFGIPQPPPKPKTKPAEMPKPGKAGQQRHSSAKVVPPASKTPAESAEARRRRDFERYEDDRYYGNSGWGYGSGYVDNAVSPLGDADFDGTPNIVDNTPYGGSDNSYCAPDTSSNDSGSSSSWTSDSGSSGCYDSGSSSSYDSGSSSSYDSGSSSSYDSGSSW